MLTTLTSWLRPSPARRRRPAGLAGVERLETRDVPDATPFALAVSPTGGLFQDWSVTPTDRITTNNNWSGVPSIEGYRGGGLTASTAGDPQTVTAAGILLTDTPAGVLWVTANQSDPNSLFAGGPAEFDRGAFAANPVVALRAATGSADSPFLLFYLDATAATGNGVTMSYLLRDVQTSASGVIPVVAQYRVVVTGTEAFVNVPGSLAADGTTDGNDLAFTFQLPAAVNGQANVQVRLITTVPAAGSAEWVGVDYVRLSASRPPTLSLPASVGYTEGTTQAVVPSGTAGDLDSPNLDQGTLSVAITSGLNAAQDVLSIGNLGSITYTPATRAVRFNGVQIGTVDAAKNGANGQPLLVTFNASATPAAAQALLRAITYTNTSRAPDTTPRILTFTMTDGDGGLSFPATITLTTTTVNDAPVHNPDPLAAGPVDYLLNTAPIPVAPDATVSDPDFPGAPDLNGGILTVTVVSGAHPDNRLTVRSSPTSGPDTINVTPSGNIEYTPTSGPAQIVGRIASSGRGTLPLAVEFNNALVTPAVAQLIYRNVTFQTVGTSFTLDDRVLRFNLTDGDGINQDLANSLVHYSAFDQTRTIHPLPANTVPSFAVPAAAPAVAEDSGDQTVPGFATAISPGLAAYESDPPPGQVLTFTLTPADTTLFDVQPAIDPLTGDLTYTPAPNAFGTVTVSVVLSDDGANTVIAAGVPDPGMSSAAKTFTITLNPVADTPPDVSGSTAEDTQTALVLSPNAVDGASVTHFKITAVRGGTLFLNDGTTPVPAGTFVTAAQATAGLKFTPALDLNDASGAPAGGFGFDFRASVRGDDTGLGGATATASVNVSPVNDAPVLGAIGSPAPTLYLATTTPLVVAPGATVADVDSADFDTGVLTVDFTNGVGANDRLAVRNQGAGPGMVGVVAGSTLTYGGVIIGTIAGGLNGAPLVVSFTNTLATRAAVEAVVRNITFSTPNTAGVRTVRFTLTDGDGGTSNQPLAQVDVKTSVAALSLVRAGASPTNSGTVSWTLTTDLPIPGLAPGNFTLTGSLAGPGLSTVSSVTPVNPGPSGESTTYTIVATVGGAGDGTLGITLQSGVSGGLQVSNAPFAGGAGALYDIDRNGPRPPDPVTFVNDDPNADNLVALNQVITYTVVFSESPVAASVQNDDFDNAGTAPVDIAVTGVSGNTVTVTVTPTGAGTVRLRVPATATILDALGNDDPNGYADSVVLTADAVPPAVVTFANNTNSTPANVAAPNAAVTYTVTFAEDIDAATVTAADFANAGTAAVTIGAVTAVSPRVFTVVVTPTTVGTLRLQVGPALTDVAGNLMAAAATDPTTVAVNLAPVAAADARTVTEDGGTVTFPAAQGVLANDTDANVTDPRGPADALTVDTTPVTGTTKGTLVLRADGSFDYTPFADAFGADSFVYRVRDLFGGVATATATITITAVNDAPTYTLAPSVTVGEDSGSFQGTVLTNLAAGGTGAFVETDAFNPVAVTVVLGATDPTVSFSSLPAITLVGNTGRLSFTPNPNAFGTATVRVTVSDVGGSVAPNQNATTKTFTIVVTPVNDAPSFFLTSNPPVSAEDGGPQVVPGFATFNPGPNEATTGQTPVYTLTVLSTTGNLRFTSPPAIDATGALSYQAAPDAFGTATVQVAVADSAGAAGTATQSFVIVVRAQNDLPVANPDTALVAKDADPTVINVLANDSPDPDGSEVLQVSAVGAPAHGTATVAPGGFGVLYTPAPGFVGTDTFPYTIVDGNGGPASSTVTVTVRPFAAGQPLTDVLAIGAGPGGGPVVRVVSVSTGAVLTTFAAYDPNFRGGVNVAAGDVNGDGVVDIVVTPGGGGGPHVKVIDGSKLGLVGADGAVAPEAVLASFYAYDPSFRGGVTVAAADVDGDGKADIITGTGPGGGAHVKVLSAARVLATPALGNGQVNPGVQLASFFAYDSRFRGGVNVAAGDVNGDGLVDVVTAAGSGGGSHVKVFNGLGGEPLLRSFFAYGADFSGGVNVAAGDVNGDGRADIITGAGIGGGSHVKVFDSSGAQLASFFGLTGSAAGADVAYRVTQTGLPLVVVGGQTGGSQVRTFSAPEFLPYNGFDAFEPTFLGGVEVG